METTINCLDIFKNEETHLFVALQSMVNFHGKFELAITYLSEEQKFMLLNITEKAQVYRVDYPINPHPWGNGKVDPTRSTIMFREENSSLTFLGIPMEFLQWKGYAYEEDSMEQKAMMQQLGESLCRIMNQTSREYWSVGSGRIKGEKMRSMYLNSDTYFKKGENIPSPFEMLKEFENSYEFSELKRRTRYADYRRDNPGSELY